MGNTWFLFSPYGINNRSTTQQRAADSNERPLLVSVSLVNIESCCIVWEDGWLADACYLYSVFLSVKVSFPNFLLVPGINQVTLTHQRGSRRGRSPAASWNTAQKCRLQRLQGMLPLGRSQREMQRTRSSCLSPWSCLQTDRVSCGQQCKGNLRASARGFL